MMQAVVSGRAGTALLIDGDRFVSIHAHDLEVEVPRRPADYRLLFADARDLVFLEDVQIDRVRDCLSTAVDADDSLHLTLMLLDPDPDRPDDLRIDAARELDERLCSEPVRERLERTMLAEPLPARADTSGALEICSVAEASRARQFFERLVALREHARAVRIAWNEIPESTFGPAPKARPIFQATAVREGLFRDLVLGRAEDEPVDKFHMIALTNPAVRSLPAHRQVVQAWVQPFNFREQLEASPVDELRKQIEPIYEYEHEALRNSGRSRKAGDP